MSVTICSASNQPKTLCIRAAKIAALAAESEEASQNDKKWSDECFRKFLEDQATNGILRLFLSFSCSFCWLLANNFIFFLHINLKFINGLAKILSWSHVCGSHVNIDILLSLYLHRYTWYYWVVICAKLSVLCTLLLVNGYHYLTGFKDVPVW